MDVHNQPLSEQTRPLSTDELTGLSSESLTMLSIRQVHIGYTALPRTCRIQKRQWKENGSCLCINVMVCCSQSLLRSLARMVCLKKKMAVFFSGTSEALINALFETPGYLRKRRMIVLSQDGAGLSNRNSSSGVRVFGEN